MFFGSIWLFGLCVIMVAFTVNELELQKKQQEDWGAHQHANLVCALEISFTFHALPY